MQTRNPTEVPSVLGVIAAATVGCASIANADPSDRGYFHDHGMMGWGGWIFGPIMIVVFLALLVAAIVIIVRLLGPDGSRRGTGQPDRAIEILRERFARGEITRQEFDEARKALE